MGYYVLIEESTVVLPNEHLDNVWKRWKEMNSSKYNNIKSGGSWEKGEKKAFWYSWLSEKYDTELSGAEELLKELGFEYSKNKQGIVINSYDGKTGQEDLFFKKIADLIPANQYIKWKGEDGNKYNWFFDGKNLNEVSDKQLKSLLKPSSEKKENNKKDLKNKL